MALNGKSKPVSFFVEDLKYIYFRGGVELQYETFGAHIQHEELYISGYFEALRKLVPNFYRYDADVRSNFGVFGESKRNHRVL